MPVGRPGTACEHDARILEGAGSGLTDEQIGERVGKSARFVRGRRAALGLTSRAGAPPVPVYRVPAVHPRDTTAALMGDPLPGMSALDQRGK